MNTTTKTIIIGALMLVVPGSLLISGLYLAYQHLKNLGRNPTNTIAKTN